MIAWLDPQDPFPPVERALGPATEAPGLLAASRDLSPQRLLLAYRQGIFPWYSIGQPVLWWSTDPRMVLAPQALKVSATFRKTLRRVLRDPDWEIRVDDDFLAVMRACALTPRDGQDGTWITREIVSAYGACTATAWRTRWRPGTAARASAGSTAWRWDACSMANRCSRTAPMPPRSRSQRCARSSAITACR